MCLFFVILKIAVRVCSLFIVKASGSKNCALIENDDARGGRGLAASPASNYARTVCGHSPSSIKSISLCANHARLPPTPSQMLLTWTYLRPHKSFSHNWWDFLLGINIAQEKCGGVELVFGTRFSFGVEWGRFCACSFLSCIFKGHSVICFKSSIYIRILNEDMTRGALLGHEQQRNRKIWSVRVSQKALRFLRACVCVCVPFRKLALSIEMSDHSHCGKNTIKKQQLAKISPSQARGKSRRFT